MKLSKQALHPLFENHFRVARSWKNAVPRRSEKVEGTPGTHCLRMRLICYWAIALWTLVTSTYELGFVDDVLASY